MCDLAFPSMLWSIQVVKSCSLWPAQKAWQKAPAWSELNYSECFQTQGKHSFTMLEWTTAWPTGSCTVLPLWRIHFQELFAGQPKPELSPHADRCQASFAQKTTINATSTSLLPTSRGAQRPPQPRPTGRGCELLAILTQCDRVLSHSDPHCIRVNHDLLIIYKNLINTFHFPRENSCMMKNNSPSISRDRHAPLATLYPSEDQLDGVKHKFPCCDRHRSKSLPPTFTKRQVTPSVALKAERWVWTFKILKYYWKTRTTQVHISQKNPPVQNLRRTPSYKQSPARHLVPLQNSARSELIMLPAGFSIRSGWELLPC